MNGMSFSDICCLLCCPPCPSRIAAKLAFLPPDATYSLHPTSGDRGGECRIELTERAEWQYTTRELEQLDTFFVRTSRRNRVACMYVRCVPEPSFVLLFSHGNGVDLGQVASFFIGLGTRLNCNVLGYDYSGYGVSTGRPLEKNMYADIEAAWQALRNRFGITPEKIVLYGQSIGTVPTIDLASKYEVAGVILHSPLMSGMRVVLPETKRTYCFDVFANIEKVPRITSPVLVIHGTEDDVIDFSHGLTIYEKCPRTVDPLWIEGGGHNDVELYEQYLDRLKRFLAVDLRPVST